MNNDTPNHAERTCVIAQPTFIPWIGWFDLADQADMMIILDDVQFSKQSWQQRNRLRTPEGLSFLSMPVKSSGRSHQIINEVELANEASIEKLLRSIQGYCARAPFFRELFPGFSAAMREGAATGKLAELNIVVIRWIMQTLGITVPLVRSSELKTDGKRGEYVAALCEKVGASRYLSPAGAEEYLLLDRHAFDRRNISVWLHVYEHPEYRQCFKPFAPYASVLDLIFNTGPEALAILRSGRRPPRALGASPQKIRRRHVVRVDASTQMGIGHLMRCMTLADRLHSRGGEIHFIARSLPPPYHQQLAERGHHVHLLPPAAAPQAVEADSPAHALWLGAGWREDAEQSAALIAGIGGADTLIIDHYAIDERWERVLRPVVRQICVIDDLADRRHDCDVLLDQNYFPEFAERYQGLLPAHCRLLCGPSHALLRSEFLDATVQRPRDGSIHRVLVFYGGADPDNLTGLTLDALQPRLGRDLQVDVVVGAINPHVEVLRARCAGQQWVRLHVQASNMAQLMASADLAFGACGTATWERCILGLPAIVVVLADNQRPSTQALVNAGVVLSLGEVSGLTGDQIAGAIDHLIADPELCREMSAKARAIMHTDDAPIEEILEGDLPFRFEDLQLCRAVQTDAPNLLAWRNQEDVRFNSRNREVIDLAEHADWLAAVIADPARHLLIGHRQGKPIGVVRLDERDNTGEVSIYLTPDARGQNNGSVLLRAQEAWIRATRPHITQLVAVVLGDNAASHNLFLKNGYTRLPSHYEKRITR